MRVGVAPGGYFTRHVQLRTFYVELNLYADDTIDTATSVRRLRELRIAINTSKGCVVLSAMAGRRIPKPRPDQFLGEPFQWVDTARYLG